MSRRLLFARSAACATAAVALYALSLPPFGLDLLAFVVAAPLALLVLDPGRTLRRTELLAAALLFGEGATLAVGGHWLFHAAHGYFGRSVVFSALFTAVVTLTHAGVFIAAAVACASRLARLPSPIVRAAAFACTWVAFELLRARLLYGCPWDLLGHALYRRTMLTQAASLGGAYLLSWTCVFTGSLLGLAWLERGRIARSLAMSVLALALPVAAGLAGAVTAGMQGPEARDESAEALGDSKPATRHHGRGELRPLRVGLVQPNVGRRELWDVSRRAEHLRLLLELSRSPALEGADLVVWPENAVPFLLDADAEAQARIAELARERNTFVLTGAPRAQAHGDGKALLHNSVYLFSPDTDTVATYDKTKLLPFIERTPNWATMLFGGLRAAEMWPGDRGVLFDVRGWKIAPLICFESTYPELAREAALGGADLLVNVSNDSWFDEGAAPQQHFAMTVLRAPELRLPIVRVANTGVSAAVNEEGEVTVEMPAKTSEVRLVTIRPPSGGSLYRAWGDAFAWLCCLLALSAIASARRG